MAEDRYTVGQVLFVVSKKDNRVVPIRVIEEVTRRALEGEKRTYNVQVGPTGDKPVVDIGKIPGLIFKSPGDVRIFMMKNATGAIDTMIKAATASANKWYGQSPAGAVNQVDDLLDNTTFSVEQEELPQNEDGDLVEVVLPDGRTATAKANVRIMPERQG